MQLSYTNLLKIIITTGLIVLFYVVPLGADDIIIWPCLVIFYYYFIRSMSKPLVLASGVETYFKIEVLFLLFYYLLLYFPYQMQAIGQGSIKENPWLFNTYWKYSNDSILASTIGLIAFMTGFERRIKVVPKRVNAFYSERQYRIFFNVLMVLLAIFSVIFFFTGWVTMLANKYTGSTSGDTTSDGVYFLLSLFVVMLSGFLIAYYRNFKRLRFSFIIFLGYFCLYSAALLITGDRNVFFLGAVTLFGGFFTYIRKISRTQLFILAIMALGLYQVIEISRNSDKRGLEAIVDVIDGQAKSNKKVSAEVDQGSLSNTTLVARETFFAVPGKHTYFWGKFKLIGFAGIIPYSRTLLVDPNDPFVTSSQFLTKTAGSDFGLGTSIISDVYLDFGMVGILGIMYALGYLANYLRSKVLANKSSIKWNVIYMMILSTYSQIPRYSVDFIARYLAWTFFLFWLFEAMSKPRLKKNPAFITVKKPDNPSIETVQQ